MTRRNPHMPPQQMRQRARPADRVRAEVVVARTGDAMGGVGAMEDGDELIMSEVEGRVYSADGVRPVRFERRGGELVNDETITLRPGDWIDLGAVPGSFTLTLQTAAVDPGIVEMFTLDEPGELDL